MTTPVFGKSYADQYDLLYQEKDYQAECDLLEKVFQKYHSKQVQTILDLGCGTGKHAVILAKRGYKITGVDRSLDMLAKARQAVSALEGINHNGPTFRHGDLGNLNLGHKFEAVVMMFAVLGYQLTNTDVLAALRTVRQHLQPGGLFIADVWYGPAVLSIQPSDRLKVISTEDGKVIRAASGSLDTFRHLSRVHYHLWRLKGQQVLSESEETHWMRYFFPQELALFMAQEQMELIHMCAFENLAEPPTEHTWNILAVGKLNQKE